MPACLQVLTELPIVATDTTADEFTAHALRASIGELCLREDRAAVAALASNASTTCPQIVRDYAPLIISHGLWKAESSSQGVMAVASGMIRFVEELLAEPEAGAQRSLCVVRALSKDRHPFSPSGATFYSSRSRMRFDGAMNVSRVTPREAVLNHCAYAGAICMPMPAIQLHVLASPW